MSHIEFLSIKTVQDTSSLSPSGEAAQMPTLFGKNTKIPGRFAI
jgi:hypothetical protein